MKELLKTLLSVNPTVVAAIIAALVGIISIVVTKAMEIRIKQRNIKEEKYIAFLSAFVSFAQGIDTNQVLTETLQVIYLVGSSEVVRATKQFVELFDPAIYGEKPPTHEEQKAAYSTMLKAMRRDLYGRRVNKQYPDRLQIVHANNAAQQLQYILRQINKPKTKM